MALTVVLLSIQANRTHAQIVVDTRGLGWNGWGGNSFTGPAEGAAQARALDAQTAMSLNEYIFQCQMAANKRYAERQAHRQQLTNDAAEARLKRLRSNPTSSDLSKGDALNVAFDDLTSPKAYAKTLQAAKGTAFPGSKIKSIPFQYASAAITTSVDELIQTENTPAVLKSAEFQADLAGLRKLQADFRTKSDEGQPIKPAQVTEAKQRVKKMSKMLKDNPARFGTRTADYREAENYLKGLYIMVTMLESPSMTNLLSGVDKQAGTTVADLLRFMHSANLRFGVARAADQREIYAELFGILDHLRTEVVGPAINIEPPKVSKKPPQLAQLFKGMEGFDFSQLDKLRILPPPPEELKKLLPPRPPGGDRRPPLPPPPPFGP
jgi:hypothetical protein